MRKEWVRLLPPPEGPGRRWLNRLVSLDILLCGLAVLLMLLADHAVIASAHPDLLLAGDTTLTERFNHLKWIAVVGLLVTVFWRTRLPAFLALAILYGMILIDDAGQLHERGGRQLGRHFRDMPDIGISGQQAGELVVWAVLGILLLPILAWAALRTTRDVWRELIPFGVAFVGLVAAAVLVDVGHDMIAHQYRASGQEQPRLLWLFLVLLENLGEAFFASLTVATAVDLAHRRGVLAQRANRGHLVA